MNSSEDIFQWQNRYKNIQFQLWWIAEAESVNVLLTVDPRSLKDFSLDTRRHRSKSSLEEWLSGLCVIQYPPQTTRRNKSNKISSKDMDPLGSQNQMKQWNERFSHYSIKKLKIQSLEQLHGKEYLKISSAIKNYQLISRNICRFGNKNH